MSPKRFLLLFVTVGLLAVVVGALVWTQRGRAAVDFGTWRVVVLQSDDWGFEGWFPDVETADAFADLASGLPDYLRAYARSGLETAAEVDTARARLSRLHDADGLPLVLQANTIVAAPTVAAADPDDAPHGWPLHASGRSSGRYARPGLDAAIDAAIAAGVWWPELHGLTHFDLSAYAAARGADDALARRARRYDTMAYTGWLEDTELAGSDPTAARRLADASVAKFRARFGRLPASVIAPDYQWGSEDEAAWAANGVQVVQAKREQIDARVDPTDPIGRLRKAVGRWFDRGRARFVYLDRPARLEPYGDASPDARQGARTAAAAVRAAWSRGEPGVVSIHRVQLASFDADVARAGWAQLATLIRELETDGGVRCLVDVEVAQLHRRGWSVLARGPWTIVRNFRDREITVDEGPLAGRTFAPGTHVLDPVGVDSVGRQ